MTNQLLKLPPQNENFHNHRSKQEILIDLPCQNFKINIHYSVDDTNQNHV